MYAGDRDVLVQVCRTWEVFTILHHTRGGMRESVLVIKDWAKCDAVFSSYQSRIRLEWVHSGLPSCFIVMLLMTTFSSYFHHHPWILCVRADEMLNEEASGLRERVADLERKLHDQVRFSINTRFCFSSLFSRAKGSLASQRMDIKKYIVCHSGRICFIKLPHMLTSKIFLKKFFLYGELR